MRVDTYTDDIPALKVPGLAQDTQNNVWLILERVNDTNLFTCVKMVKELRMPTRLLASDLRYYTGKVVLQNDPIN